MLLGSLVLGPRQLPWFVVFVLLLLAVLVPQQPGIEPRIAVTVLVVFTIGFIILLSRFRRSRLGVAGLRGESMLVDLRDRILKPGPHPGAAGRLARRAARCARPAARRSPATSWSRARHDDRLDVVVVDVSGKGEEAGTRALLLSGAFGGLLRALPAGGLPRRRQRLPARQEWDEGFATAVHLSLDLDTGHFAVRSAGHPPAALRNAGSGRWSVLEAEGPLLGLIEGADVRRGVEGVLQHGDALLLYTDGMVETSDRDIMLGIDRMLGQAERLLRGDFEGGATRLVEALGSRNDDRALLLVHRR